MPFFAPDEPDTGGFYNNYLADGVSGTWQQHQGATAVALADQFAGQKPRYACGDARERDRAESCAERREAILGEAGQAAGRSRSARAWYSPACWSRPKVPNIRARFWAAM